MTPTSGPEAHALQRAVSEVLHYVWDPIGVAARPEARNEYDGYVEGVCALLWRGTDVDGLVAYLVDIADTSMGLAGTHARADRAANILLTWRDIVTR